MFDHQPRVVHTIEIEKTDGLSTMPASIILASRKRATQPAILLRPEQKLLLLGFEYCNFNVYWVFFATFDQGQLSKTTDLRTPPGENRSRLDTQDAENFD